MNTSCRLILYTETDKRTTYDVYSIGDFLKPRRIGEAV